MEDYPVEENVPRRRFLELLLGATSALILGLIGIPLTGYAVSPALKGEKAEWVKVGPAKDLRPGEPVKVNFSYKKVDGWVEETANAYIWALNRDGKNYVAYDSHCTHLGCAYRWSKERNQFLCPCHDGIFDVDGNVLGGPPPRPLDRYETKVENGELFIGRLLRGGKST